MLKQELDSQKSKTENNSEALRHPGHQTYDYSKLFQISTAQLYIVNFMIIIPRGTVIFMIFTVIFRHLKVKMLRNPRENMEFIHEYCPDNIEECLPPQKIDQY